ncbi:hypothetical protein HZB74_01350 [Candidatus Saccharibacteria bacterium]|nr:hypothetical protein [Candidatus Saccharibacteria bacterium]
MTTCSSNGDFTINITLVPGENVLVAKTRDSVGQYGPDSVSVTIFLDSRAIETSQATPPQATVENKSSSKPMLIYIDPVQKGILIGQSITLDYEVDGSEPPYTIAIDWGDGTPTTLVKHDDEGDFSSSHIYDISGQRTVHISGIDSKGNRAYMQTIIVVHPQNPTGALVYASPEDNNCSEAGSTFSSYCFNSDSTLVKITEMAWPALIVATLMTVSFWVGEKMMLHQLKPRH